MSPYFKKAICLAFLFANVSWADMLWEDMKQPTWKDVRSELSVEEREKLDKALVSAAAKGEIDTVLNLIDRGADVNCGDRYSIFRTSRSCTYTALMMAVYYDHPEMIRLLIEKGALLNLMVTECGRLDSGQTATNFAYSNKQQEVLNILLENGALFGEPQFFAPCVFTLLNYEQYKAYERRTSPFYP